VDFHPKPAEALCDGGQAMTLEELPRLMEYVGVVRKAYREAVENSR
jgi:3-deoxy-7-phosphoheptulonate synthase